MAFDGPGVAGGMTFLLEHLPPQVHAVLTTRADPDLPLPRLLVAVRDYTFQFGPNLCAAMNALLFGTLLHRSRLVPRIIPAVGLIGAPLLIAATLATVFWLTEQGSAWFVGGLLIAAWELSVGVYMVVKGFRPVPITATGPE